MTTINRAENFKAETNRICEDTSYRLERERTNRMLERNRIAHVRALAENEARRLELPCFFFFFFNQ
jgi:hypothetical protein